LIKNATHCQSFAPEGSGVPFFWQAVCGTRRRPAKDSVPNSHYESGHRIEKGFWTTFRPQETQPIKQPLAVRLDHFFERQKPVAKNKEQLFRKAFSLQKNG
jgi:hypothetical protein